MILSRYFLGHTGTPKKCESSIGDSSWHWVYHMIGLTTFEYILLSPKLVTPFRPVQDASFSNAGVTQPADTLHNVFVDPRHEKKGYNVDTRIPSGNQTWLAGQSPIYR